MNYAAGQVLPACPPERYRHGPLIETVEADPGGARVVHLRALGATALDRAMRAGALLGTAADGREEAERRLAAGQWLAETFEAACFELAGIGRWDPGAADTAREISDEAAEARSRFNRALRALGPVASAIAEGVCCFDADPPPARWPALRRALDRLADYLAGGADRRERRQ